MKNKVLVGVLVALLLVGGVGVFTYAKFASSWKGDKDVNVADWKVSLKQGGVAVANDFDLNLVIDNSDSNAKEGTIAPGSILTATLTLDLTGTEVQTDYILELSDLSGLPQGMAISSVTAKVGSGTASELSEVSVGTKQYQGTMTVDQITNDKVVEFVITIVWDGLNDENNVDDTSFGTGDDTITIPVAITVSQHIGE